MGEAAGGGRALETAWLEARMAGIRRDPKARALARKLLPKCLIDQMLGWIVLVLASPLLLLVAAVIKLDGRIHPENAGPVFHREPRVSAGEIFYIFKFRTVTREAIRWIREAPESRSITGAKPRTAAGRWILRNYLDELPQVINIALGQMTFVGLRPHILEHTRDEVERGFPYRLMMKAGLFGVPQACKRNPKFQALIEQMGWSHRADEEVLYRLDGIYVTRCRRWPYWRIFFFDLWIAWRCLVVIFRGGGS